LKLARDCIEQHKHTIWLITEHLFDYYDKRLLARNAKSKKVETQILHSTQNLIEMPATCLLHPAESRDNLCAVHIAGSDATNYINSLWLARNVILKISI
jgi:hypothetical protein